MSSNIIVDFLEYKKKRSIQKTISTPVEKKPDIVVEITPEQLRRIALSLEQVHIGRVNASRERLEPLPEYDLNVTVNTIDKRPVSLVWYPMKGV